MTAFAADIFVDGYIFQKTSNYNAKHFVIVARHIRERNFTDIKAANNPGKYFVGYKT